MNNQIGAKHSAWWRRAMLGGSMVGIAVLVAACGGSSSKSSTAAPASGQSASGQYANSLEKFCSDNANDASMENQLGDSPDLSDPATHALLARDLNVLKAEVSEAPSAIKSDVQTLESVIATATAGKMSQGESKYDKYSNAVDAINNWTDDNCPDGASSSSNSNNNNSSSDSDTAPATDNSNDFNSINSQSYSSGGSSEQSSATDNSTVMNACVQYYESGVDGPVPDNPTATCNCVVSYLTSSDGLAAAAGGSYSVSDLESEFQQDTEEGIPSMAASQAGMCLQGPNADPATNG